MMEYSSGPALDRAVSGTYNYVLKRPCMVFATGYKLNTFNVRGLNDELNQILELTNKSESSTFSPCTHLSKES